MIGKFDCLNFLESAKEEKKSVLVQVKEKKYIYKELKIDNLIDYILEIDLLEARYIDDSEEILEIQKDKTEMILLIIKNN